jgi:hypothetical protein
MSLKAVADPEILKGGGAPEKGDSKNITDFGPQVLSFTNI